MFKVTLDPQEKWVTVTIENDEDARRFCDAACELVSEGVTEPSRRKLKEVYDEYANIMIRDNTAHWDRGLWDAVIQTSHAGGCTVQTTFGAALLHKLGII